MKKLLTVSLFAIMAVSAANADIASTKYVDDAKAGAIATAASDATAKANAAQTAAEAKVTELDSSLSDVAKTGAYADLTGIPTVDSTFSATSDNAATSKAIAGYVATVKNELSNGNTAAVTGLQEQIDALDDDYVSETEIAAYSTTAQMNSAIAAADTALETSLKTYADTAEADAIAAAKTAGDAAYDSKGSAAQALTDAKAYADAEDKKIEDTIGTVDTGKTVVQMITEAKNAASTGATEALDAYKESNDAAVQTAQAAAEAAQADADANAQAIAGLDTTYVSESEMSSFKTSNTSAIATAKSEAIEAAATDATTKANAAQSAAEAKVTALENGAVKTNATNITTITTNLGGLNGVEIPAACATGRCALVMEGGEAKWETINY